MTCPKCGSDAYRNGTDRDGMQKYRCKSCTFNFRSNTVVKTVSTSAKVGMSLNEFREKFDVDFIVDKTLAKLDPNIIYEKNDICKMTGLRPGYPGLSQTIENQKLYFGKVGSTMYFSHPDTIKKLKNEAKLM